METPIRPSVVKLLARFIRPLTDEGLIYVREQNEILSNLKHLSQKGTLLPNIIPKLVDTRIAAEMVGVSLSNFKKLERDGHFEPWFKRKYVGSSVRYKNTDIIKFIMDDS